MKFGLVIWVFPKIVVPQWMVKIRENPIKMDDLGGKNPIFGNTHIMTPVFRLFFQSGFVFRHQRHGSHHVGPTHRSTEYLAIAGTSALGGSMEENDPGPRWWIYTP